METGNGRHQKAGHTGDAGRWRRAGQALVEFALVLPLLALLDPLGCPGDSAAAETAAGEPITIYGVVDDQLNQGFGLHVGSTAVLTPPPQETADASAPQNAVVTLTVSLPYRPLLAMPPLLPATVTLVQSYSMMVEVPEATNPNGTLVSACP
jgi:hypothetical protein